MRAIRWSDNDRYFGRFTYAHERRSGRGLTIMLGSGHDEYPGCRLRVGAFGHTLIVALPAIIKPHRTWYEITSEPTRSQIIAQGREPGYWDEHDNEYGFSFFEGSLHTHYGAQTHDSRTDKTKVWFLPWRSWRFIRLSLYDIKGDHWWTDLKGRWSTPAYAHNESAKARCPSTSFEFADFDGERIIAKTLIEEREWAFGEGKFKWLSLFRRNKVNRSLDLWFSSEVGRRKGSWKGGTIGHSIEMLPDELHEAAFRRYCEQHKLTFIGLAQGIEAAPAGETGGDST